SLHPCALPSLPTRRSSDLVTSVTSNAPASYPLGINLVTWTVADSSGNTSSCVQRVIVVDTTAPTITCPPDLTVSANGGCAATNRSEEHTSELQSRFDLVCR